MIPSDSTPATTGRTSPQASPPSDLDVLDALTDHICILDASGIIVAANRAWRDSAVANPPLSRRANIGDDYFSVCEAAAGDGVPIAQQALRGLRAVAQGDLPEFTLEYPCHSPDTQRWFELRATRLADGGAGRLVIAHRNVTRRKLAEEALHRAKEDLEQRVAERAATLRESETRFRSLFDHMLNGFAYCQMLFDEHGRPDDFVYLAVNDAFARLTGLKDVIGKRVTQVIPRIKELHPELFGIYGRVASTGNSETFELDFKPLDLCLSISVYSREKSRFVAVFENIGERKAAERKIAELNQNLQRRVAELQAILDASPIGLAIAEDPEGLHIRGNPANERQLGLSPGSELSLREPHRASYRAFRNGQEVAVDALPMQRACRGETVMGQTLDILRPDGKTVTLYSCAVPLRDERGKPRGAVGAFLDITALKRAEKALEQMNETLEQRVAERTAALQELNQKLDALLAESPLAVIVLDPAGRVSLWNPAAERMFGWSYAEVAGQPLPTLLGGSEDEFARLRQRVAAGEIIRACEARRRRKDGTIVEVHAAFAPLHDARGQCIGTMGILADITQRKQAEVALRESEAKFSAAFRASPDLMAITRLADGKILEVNESYSRMLGYSRQESLGKTTQELGIWASPQDRSRFAAALRDSGEIADLETRLRRKDGSLIIVLDSARTMIIGDEVLVLSVAQDITDRTRAAAALRESEERYRSLVASSLDAVLLTAPDGRILTANEAACAMFGCSEPELVNLGREGVVDRSDPRLASALRERERTGRARSELTFIRRDGTRFEGEVSSSVFRTSQGDARTSMVIRDITARKRAEAALRLASLYNRSLIEASLDPLVTIGPDGRITDVNGATEEATGWSRAKLVGTDFSDYFTEPERARAGYQQVFREGSVRDYPLRIRHREGRTIPVLYNAALYRDETGEVIGVFAAARDITEREQSEVEVRRLAGRLLKAEEAERRRLGRALHDSTAQKIAGLIMSLGQIEDAMGNADEGLRRRLVDAQALAQECARELRTTSHLLHPPLLEEMGLEVAMDTYIAGFTQRSGIEVQTRIPEDLGRLSAEAEIALFRVVQESLGNIHRHSGSRVATVALTRFADRLVLEVQDQGHGIPDEQLRRLREHASAFGVGIAGMQERLLQLGGLLEIDSTSAGTTIRAIVPVQGASREAEGGRQAAP